MNVSQKMNVKPLQALVKVGQLLFRPESINRMVAGAGKTLTQRHLIELAAARGKFYGNFARGVHAEASVSRADVVIPPAFGSASSTQRGNPLAAHFYGRTFTQADLFGINPKTGEKVKHFVIPTEAARGQRPADYGDRLQAVFGKKGVVGLALRQGGSIPENFTGARKKQLKSSIKEAQKKGLNPLLFILVKGFKLKGGDGVGDKTVLPTPDEYAMAAMSIIQKNLQEAFARRGLA